MGMELATKDLEITESRSRREIVTIEPSMAALATEAAKRMPPGATAVLWQVDGIVWGRWDGAAFCWAGEARAEDILELRLFSAAAELHLALSDGRLVGRYVVDGEGGSASYVDCFSRLWGRRVDTERELPEGFLRLRDRERGLTLDIPAADASADWYGLATRSYIACDEATGLAGYDDYRFLSIDPAQEV